jgi:hypothetical protein
MVSRLPCIPLLFPSFLSFFASYFPLCLYFLCIFHFCSRLCCVSSLFLRQFTHPASGLLSLFLNIDIPKPPKPFLPSLQLLFVVADPLIAET